MPFATGDLNFDHTTPLDPSIGETTTMEILHHDFSGWLSANDGAGATVPPSKRAKLTGWMEVQGRHVYEEAGYVSFAADGKAALAEMQVDVSALLNKEAVDDSDLDAVRCNLAGSYEDGGEVLDDVNLEPGEDPAVYLVEPLQGTKNLSRGGRTYLDSMYKTSGKYSAAYMQLLCSALGSVHGDIRKVAQLRHFYANNKKRHAALAQPSGVAAPATGTTGSPAGRGEIAAVGGQAKPPAEKAAANDAPASTSGQSHSKASRGAAPVQVRYVRRRGLWCRCADTQHIG